MFAFLFFWCRTEGTVRDQVTGAVFKVTKGAPHVILKLVQKANDSMISQVREVQLLRLMMFMPLNWMQCYVLLLYNALRIALCHLS